MGCKLSSVQAIQCNTLFFPPSTLIVELFQMESGSVSAYMKRAYGIKQKAPALM